MVPDVPGLLDSGRLGCRGSAPHPLLFPPPEDDYSGGKCLGFVELPLLDPGRYCCHYLTIIGFLTAQPLRAVGVLFSPMVSGWAGKRREKFVWPVSQKP